MNENIDLTKILKGLEGIKLYTTVYGYITLKKVDESCIGINLPYNAGFLILEPKGNLQGYKGECIIFPSKNQRDWSKFVRPIKKYTPVMCQTKEGSWILKYFFKKRNNEYYVFDYKDGAGYHLWEGAIIQYKDFNPNDIEGSLKYNIQK